MRRILGVTSLEFLEHGMEFQGIFSLLNIVSTITDNTIPVFLEGFCRFLGTGNPFDLSAVSQILATRNPKDSFHGSSKGGFILCPVDVDSGDFQYSSETR